MLFDCTKCGICCKNIDKVPELAMFDKGDGTCIHLTADNLCDIYDTRPNICNVVKMYQTKYHQSMSWTEYEALNTKACKIMQENAERLKKQK